MTTREREEIRADTEPEAPSDLARVTQGLAEAAPAPGPAAAVGPAPSGAADTTRYSQQDVGRIMALASELQARDRSLKSDAAGLDRQQLMALASELGIEPRYLESALTVARQCERAILIEGTAAAVRARLIKHFSGVCLTPAMASTVAPKIATDEPGALLVDWGGRALRLSFQAGPVGKTIVSWETRLAPAELAMLPTKLGGGILGLSAAVCAGFGLGVLAGLFASCAGILYIVEKTEISENERSFAEFCRTHIENVQLVAGSETDEETQALPGCPTVGASPSLAG